jgi:hypothetical protein
MLSCAVLECQTFDFFCSKQQLAHAAEAQLAHLHCCHQLISLTSTPAPCSAAIQIPVSNLQAMCTTRAVWRSLMLPPTQPQCQAWATALLLWLLVTRFQPWLAPGGPSSMKPWPSATGMCKHHPLLKVKEGCSFAQQCAIAAALLWYWPRFLCLAAAAYRSIICFA